MKLSLKELELIKRGLNQVTCTGDPTYKKICKKIHRKKQGKVCGIKIEYSKETIKEICDIVNSRRKESLQDLCRDIPALVRIESRGCFKEGYTTLVLNVDLLRKGEGQRIFNFKDQNPDVNIKIE